MKTLSDCGMIILFNINSLKGKVIQMSNYVDVFLMKSVLGRKVDKDKPETVIRGCIDKAYGDMMDAGRYVKIENKDDKCEKVYELLEEHKYCFSMKLIEETKSIFGKEVIFFKGRNATAFGLSQKLINMTFKYLYCFWDFIGLGIDFTKCDCPVDSIILNGIPANKLPGKSSFAWSRLDEQQYENVQKAIDEIVQESLNQSKFETPIGLPACSPRLLYDFHAW